MLRKNKISLERFLWRVNSVSELKSVAREVKLIKTTNERRPFLRWTQWMIDWVTLIWAQVFLPRSNLYFSLSLKARLHSHCHRLMDIRDESLQLRVWWASWLNGANTHTHNVHKHTLRWIRWAATENWINSMKACEESLVLFSGLKIWERDREGEGEGERQHLQE